MNETNNPFWDFSLDFYGREGVAESCLALQDEFNADVNIVLYCCWVAFKGAEALTLAELTEIIVAIEPWQSSVVQPLRQIRGNMKQDDRVKFGPLSEELRQMIKNCELEGEKIEQWVLYQSGQREFPEVSARGEAAAQTAAVSLKTYLQRIQGEKIENGDGFIQFITCALSRLAAA